MPGQNMCRVKCYVHKGVITGTKLFFSWTIKRTRPVSKLVKKHKFSKQDQVVETDLVVGLRVEKVGNH